MRKFLVFFFFICIGTSLCYSIKETTDSLKLLLIKNNTPSNRVEILQQLSMLRLEEPDIFVWLRQMQQEAQKAQLWEKEEWAIRNLVRSYYNAGKTDSITYYAEKSDSLAKANGQFTDNYFDTQSFYCVYLLWDGQTEKVANIAIQLYDQAKKNNNTNGIICSYELQALINQRINRDSTAVNYFKECLLLLEQFPDQYRWKNQILNNMIESELKANYLKEARIHLEQLQKLNEDIKNGHFAPDPSFPYFNSYIQLHCFYINLCVREKNKEEAMMHIKLIQDKGAENADYFIQIQYLYSLTYYYQYTQQDQLALDTINKLLTMDNSLEAIKLKADILFHMGNTAEAALQYLKALNLNEEMQSVAFTRQLSQLHTAHKVSNLELQVKELRVKELELNARQQQLRWTLAMVAVLTLLLLIGAYSYMHTNRLKNELLKEKNALLKSESELRIARDQAQESDRVKSLFLSNMSHEIRTPLNAIVGFAQILETEIAENQELSEYTHIIINNSSLLLNLVNDILDISRLESERYRFTFAQQNLAECCRSALASVEHRVKPGVELRFTPSDENFILNTDLLRLQQVLINLVGNASKFTEQGYIELTYTVVPEEGVVRFSVTDTGCGIPKDKQDSIFERFEKLNENIQGTGLGLSICRIIAERFNGKVFLDKEYTGGARFIFMHALNL